MYVEGMFVLPSENVSSRSLMNSKAFHILRFKLILSMVLSLISVFSASCLMLSNKASAQGDGYAVTRQAAGVRPFLALIAGNYAGSVKSATFTILPQPGSYTRPIKATYSAAYLQSTGNLSANTIYIPIFGLYDNARNTVDLYINFNDGNSIHAQVGVLTNKYIDPCSSVNTLYNNVQNRTSTSDLPYDYYLLKDFCSTNSPVIFDTDGRIRWVGTAGIGARASIFNNNSIYITNGNAGINRIAIETGAVTSLADFGPNGVTSTTAHNIDYGRNGTMIVETDNGSLNLESNALEFDVHGKVLNQWDLGSILSNTITAAGGQASGFVAPGKDWFHMNATAYNPIDNTLVVSSRENGVFDVDYDTPANGTGKQLHWVLGDVTKNWYRYFSQYSLSLGSAANNSGAAPIGQHSVSIDTSGNLLVLTDGLGSSFQNPPGISRSLSFANSYALDVAGKKATPEYNFTPQPSLYSSICGSAYDFKTAHLIDFANGIPAADKPTLVDIFGLGPATGNANKLVFHTQFQNVDNAGNATPCASGWNAVPLDLSNMIFN